MSDWLLDGLAGFLTDLFIKKYLGNNEARYRRYKVFFLLIDLHLPQFNNRMLCKYVTFFFPKLVSLSPILHFPTSL